MLTTEPPHPLPRLLVSVRDALEAKTALAAGVDWIDVKEPSRGPLGRADLETIEAVVECVNGRTPVSAALGDLDEVDSSLVDRIAGMGGLSLVKIGLAGTASSPDWHRRWVRIVDRFVKSLPVAAVAYADWERAKAPPPRSVLEIAAGRCRSLLIDSFYKSGPSTVDLLAPSDLINLVAAAKGEGMLTVVAGRLGVESLPAVCRAAPDLVGIRGAACRGDRTQSLDETLIRMVRRSLQESAALVG